VHECYEDDDWLVIRGLVTGMPVRGIVAFVLLGAMASTTVSATFGVTSLALGDYASWASYGRIWLTWWLGDAVGDIIVAPLLILWTTKPRWKVRRERLLESLALVSYLSLSGQITFGGLFHGASKYKPLEFLCVPALAAKTLLTSV
jgi:integral membrane sensor domain MASE1